jgi:hypothetical protein
MSGTVPVRETRAVLLERAREALKLAESETLPHRARIHIAAAKRWIALADRKLKRERFDEAPSRGCTVQPSPQSLTYY